MGRKRLERNRPLLFLPAAKTTEIDHQMYDAALIMEKNLQIYPLFRILPDGYATPSLDYWSKMNLTTPKKLRAKSSVWDCLYSDIRI